MNTFESRQNYLENYKIYILNQHTNLSVILDQQKIVSHNNYNFSASEGFVIFLTSKSKTCFIDDFTLIMKSQSTAYLLNGSEHICWILDLKVKCTQCGICSQVAFKNARAMFFRSRAGRAIVFGRVQKNPGRGQKFHGRVAPAQI